MLDTTERNRAPGSEPGGPSGSTALMTTNAWKRGVTAVCAACALMTSVIVVAPPALAASSSTSAALKGWYQESGHRVLEKFIADGERLTAVNASTTAKVARQDCNDLRRDALSASNGSPPPQPVLKQEYRYFLLAAVKSFTGCMTGISSSNDAQI